MARCELEDFELLLRWRTSVDFGPLVDFVLFVSFKLSKDMRMFKPSNIGGWSGSVDCRQEMMCFRILLKKFQASEATDSS